MLPLKQIYSGRIGRANFVFGTILFIIMISLIMFIAVLVNTVLSAFKAGTASMVAVFYLACLLSILGGFIFIVPLWARRLHDLNKSGWYLIIYLLIGILNYLFKSTGNVLFSVISLILWVVYVIMLACMLFIPGNREANKYGNPPSKGLSNFIKEIFNQNKPIAENYPAKPAETVINNQNNNIQ